MHCQAPCQINPSQTRRQESDRSRARGGPCRLFAERNASSPRSRTWEVAEHSREWQRLIHALDHRIRARSLLLPSWRSERGRKPWLDGLSLLKTKSRSADSIKRIVPTTISLQTSQKA